LTVIGGRAHLMSWRLRADDPLRQDLEIIQSTTERAANLTRQILALAPDDPIRQSFEELVEKRPGIRASGDRLAESVPCGTRR
jgi:signal transduction histidine kinase